MDRGWFSWLVALPLMGAASLRVFVPLRSDYLGHYLSGFGASLLFMWVVSRMVRDRPGVVVIATLVCIGLGYVCESVLFPLGGFDWMDFYTQSMGAAIAGLALVQLSTSDPEDGGGVIVAGVAALMIGGYFAFA